MPQIERNVFVKNVAKCILRLQSKIKIVAQSALKLNHMFIRSRLSRNIVVGSVKKYFLLK